MEGSNPKISFIPKGSLVREDSFLERRRPRSVIGIVAGIIFVVAVASYGTLYYLNNTLNEVVKSKKIEIEKVKQAFSNAPEVAEAKVFRARADLARDLLSTHRVTSPILAFLAENTTESIVYDRFTFAMSPEGQTVKLSGEAPSYAALAFQADVLKKKEKEISKFAVRNVALTKFGTITFTLDLVFKPDYLLYSKNLANKARDEKPLPKLADTDVSIASSTSEGLATTTRTTLTEDRVVANEAMATGTPPESARIYQAPKVSQENMSVLKRLWSQFKFW